MLISLLDFTPNIRLFSHIWYHLYHSYIIILTLIFQEFIKSFISVYVPTGPVRSPFKNKRKNIKYLGIVLRLDNIHCSARCVFVGKGEGVCVCVYECVCVCLSECLSEWVSEWVCVCACVCVCVHVSYYFILFSDTFRA